jgi:hypothetical protein
MTRRLLFAAAALLLLFPMLLSAQNEFPTVEFTGTVQSANATALVINGLLIDISSAQISAPVVAGTAVRVRASFASDGNLIALNVDPVAPGMIAGLVEINGVIEQIDGSTLLVGRERISIAGAKVDMPLAVGAFVIVYAEQTSPTEWTAVLVTGIRYTDPIFIAETPEVGASPLPDVPVAAATVEVNPVQTSEVGVIVVTPEISAPGSTPEIFAPASTPEVENGEDIDIRGTLDGFTDAEVIVDGRRYFIGGAEIDGRLILGAQVRLEIRVVNGKWVLEEIRVEDSDDDRGGNSGSESSSGSGGGEDD